ncbi:MAG: ECF transporter S component [Coriobacteriales bacterium]|nr:ECF transporter S component [Coriobacteriales bacterium]
MSAEPDITVSQPLTPGGSLPIALSSKPSTMSRFLDIFEPVLLIIVPVVLFASIIFGVRQTTLLSALVALVALVPFFLRFESAGVKPRDIMPIVVMSAIAVALRILMTPIFYLTPVSAIVIIAGLGFGKRSGFMTGALIAIVSNLFLGQGPWTPWQMYLWGLMGYVSGAVAGQKWTMNRWQVCIFGAIMSLTYNTVMDSYSAFGFIGASTVEGIIAIYIAGLSYGFMHIVSTVAFLWLIYLPWTTKFVRIKAKYGIGQVLPAVVGQMQPTSVQESQSAQQLVKPGSQE